jgi:hypothetical protein
MKTYIDSFHLEVSMNPQHILRLENIAIAIFGIFAYTYLGGTWWLFALLFLTPDFSMLGYLAGNKLGADVYNFFHTSTLPLGLLAIAIGTTNTSLMQIALIWLTHIYFDRAVGYGLKLPTGFKHTHLSQ